MGSTQGRFTDFLDPPGGTPFKEGPEANSGPLFACVHGFAGPRLNVSSTEVSRRGPACGPPVSADFALGGSVVVREWTRRALTQVAGKRSRSPQPSTIPRPASRSEAVGNNSRILSVPDLTLFLANNLRIRPLYFRSMHIRLISFDGAGRRLHRLIPASG